MNLREWLVLYVKHRDILTRQLSGVEENAEHVVFTFKTHTMDGFAWENLSVPDASGKIIVATLQTHANVEFLITHWEEFVALPDLTVVFVNPKTNDKWLIKPAAHARISGGDIRQGVQTLADAVPYV